MHKCIYISVKGSTEKLFSLCYCLKGIKRIQTKEDLQLFRGSPWWDINNVQEYTELVMYLYNILGFSGLCHFVDQI